MSPAPRKRLQLTVGGILYLGVTVIIGLAAVKSQASLLFLMCGLGVGGLVASVWLATSAIDPIHVERSMPDEVIRGRPFRVTYIVRNPRRFARARSVRIDWAGGARPTYQVATVYLPDVAPGAHSVLRTTGVAWQRGRHPLRPVRVSTRFPFGLVARSITFPVEGHLTVYPAIGRLRREPWPTGRDAHIGDADRRNRPGGGEEFYGIREYRPGDNLHWIHWRRSARTRQLLVREMVRLAPMRVILILDMCRAKDIGDVASEELVSFAATVVSTALERGYHVGLVANAAVPVVLPPGRGAPYRRRLMHELALLRSHDGRSLHELVGRVRWAGGPLARCVLCSTRPDEAQAAVLRELRRRSESVTVVTPDSDAMRTFFDRPTSPTISAASPAGEPR
jgi:uncharacterized protein (DUF58 family)